MKLLKDAGFKLNEEGTDSCWRRMVPMGVAVEHGNWELVRFMVKHSVPVDPTDDRCISPLLFAINSGNAEIVKLLVDAG